MNGRGAAIGLAAGLLLVPAGAAAALEPERSGWWNRASAGGVAAPVPTSQEGDLRIASGADTPSAYAAVLFRTDGATAAALDLAVREGSVVGTPDVVACPTVEEDWPEGSNQPFDTAPAYDCARGSAFGTLSTDGTSLSFALDDLTQTSPGTWSLALVPQPGSSAGPFAVELESPGPEALTPEESSSSDTPFVSEPGGPVEGSGDGGDAGATDGGTGEAALPLLPGALDVPVDVPDLGSAEAPLLAGDVDAPVAPTAQDPAIAGAAPPPVAPPVAFRPALAAQDASAGPRLLALLVLVGGSAAVGYAAGQQRPGPRLIGGRAGSAVPPGAAVQETGPAPDRRPRGIGRFAKERDAAPRRLR